MTEAFRRYLRAKRTVDDRALDRRLTNTLRDGLASRAADRAAPLSVLDVGAGIGTMLTRALEWDLLPPGRIKYTLVDADAGALGAAPAHLREWSVDREFSVTGSATLTIEGRDRRVTARPVVGDAPEFADSVDQSFDLVVGVALLDILPLDAVGRLLEATAPGGLFYFPIVFDGKTRFRPAHPADRVVTDRYHDHMDWKPGGTSEAGTAVLDYLGELDTVTLDAVAGSDWVVLPDGAGYPSDEAYFLRHLLDTIESALGELPDGQPPALDEWLGTRRTQVDAGELVYLTHQLDFLGHVGDAD